MGVNVKQIGSVQGLGNSLVTPSLISVPFTTIVNRAQIPNLAADLSVNFGINRIPVQQIYEIPNEFGPNGERIWGAVNDTYGQIRLVGGWSNSIGVTGQFAFTATANDYVEVTFYGTGINILLGLASVSTDLRVSVDGGAEGSTILPNPSSYSGALVSRNYSANQIINGTSGLSVGVHTVRFRFVNASNSMAVYGFEIIGSATASSNITVNPGQISVGGMPGPVLASQASFAFNAPVTGNRGGRVIVYLNATGSIDRAWRATNPSAAFLSSADHTNEDTARVYHFREFGAGRSDDFSLNFASGAKSFTLEDGTTTLTGNNAVSQSINSVDTLGIVSTSNFITFTFIGTGLDVQFSNSSLSASYTYQIDGSSASSISLPASGISVVKIASGLPYGTHTFRLNFTAFVSGNMGITKFMVYQPKKPSIPTGAVELADYNVMADYSSATAGLETVSSGVLRKSPAREFIYADGTGGTASWLSPSVIADRICGTELASDRANAYLEYTFFGTGFEQRFNTSSNRSANISVTINGLAATVANFPTLTSSVYGTGVTFSAGVLDQLDATPTSGCGFCIRNLPLSLYTVRLRNNTAGGFLVHSALDIITPTHSYKNNGPFALQNTLPVGSESIGDLRKVDFQDIRGDQKAVAMAFGVNTANPGTSSTTYVPAPEMSVTIKTNGNPINISYNMSLYNNTVGAYTHVQIFVNGAAVGRPKLTGGGAGTATYLVYSDNLVVPLPAGVHKIDVYYRVLSGAIQNDGDVTRSLVVREL